MIAPLMENIDTLRRQEADLKNQLALKEEALRNDDLYLEVQELKMKSQEVSTKIEEQMDQITNAMVEKGLKSFDTMDGRRLLVKKSPGKCIITNEEIVDEKYKKEKVTITIDKKTILAELRDGKHVDGADIDYSYSLQISQK